MYVNTPTTGLSLLLMKFSARSHLHSLANFTEFVGTAEVLRDCIQHSTFLSLNPCMTGVYNVGVSDK
jgi:hypothetical protein